MTRVIIRSHVDFSLSTQMRLTWMDEFGWVEVLWRPLEFGVPVVSRNACCYFKSVRDKMMDGDPFGNTHSLSSKVWLKWVLLKRWTLHTRQVTFL